MLLSSREVPPYLLHFFQVEAGPADLIPISLSMSLTRHDLLEACPNACQDQRSGGRAAPQGLESLGRGGTEEHGAGAGVEAVALLCGGPEGHGAQVLHLLVAGGGVAAVAAAGEPADLRPLPLLRRKLSVDALQLLLRAVAVKAGVQEGPNLAALVLLVLQLVGGQRSQGTIPSSL